LIDGDIELQRLQMVIQNHFLTDEVKQNGFGAVDTARLSEAIKMVAEGFELPETPAVEAVFTDKYLPAKDTRMPPAQ
jgi:NitT/TauT family transport system substrate-binding protein